MNTSSPFFIMQRFRMGWISFILLKTENLLLKIIKKCRYVSFHPYPNGDLVCVWIPLILLKTKNLLLKNTVVKYFFIAQIYCSPATCTWLVHEQCHGPDKKRNLRKRKHNLRKRKRNKLYTNTPLVFSLPGNEKIIQLLFYSLISLKSKFFY